MIDKIYSKKSTTPVRTPLKRSACDRCRLQKLRCYRAEDDTKLSCTRCLRASISCITSPAKPLRRLVQCTPFSRSVTTSDEKEEEHEKQTDQQARRSSRLLAEGPSSSSASQPENLVPIGTQSPAASTAELDLEIFDTESDSYHLQPLMLSEDFQINLNQFLNAPETLPQIGWSSSNDTTSPDDMILDERMEISIPTVLPIEEADTSTSTTSLDDYSLGTSFEILHSQIIDTRQAIADNRSSEPKTRLSRLNLLLSQQLARFACLRTPAHDNQGARRETPEPVNYAAQDYISVDHVLHNTAEFVTIVNSVGQDLPLPQSSAGSDLGAPAILTILSCYLQIVAIYGSMVRYVYDSAMSVTDYMICPWTGVLGLRFGNFTVQNSGLQLKILTQVVEHDMEVIEMTLGVPAEYRISQTQLGTIQAQYPDSLLAGSDFGLIFRLVMGLDKQAARGGSAHALGLSSLEFLRESIQLLKQLAQG